MTTEAAKTTNPMDNTTVRRLERLRRRATLYELAMVRGDERILVAYAQARTRNALWKSVTAEKRVAAIVAKAGTETITFGKRTVDGARMGEWTIRFTGRTQRDAITEGELPYIGG